MGAYIKIYEVYEDIEFQETVFEGINKRLTDKWNWFNLYKRSGNTIVERGAIPEFQENLYDKYNIDEELSYKTNFCRYETNKLCNTEEDLKTLRENFKTQTFESIQLKDLYGRAIKEENIVRKNVEYIFVKTLFEGNIGYSKGETIKFILTNEDCKNFIEELIDEDIAVANTVSNSVNSSDKFIAIIKQM